MSHLWPAMREAVAQTAHEHWHALRLIAPDIDPRTIAAETVATSATAVLQTPTLWRLLHTAEALADPRPRARRIALSAGLTLDDLARLASRIEAMDRSARAWSAEAYGRKTG